MGALSKSWWNNPHYGWGRLKIPQKLTWKSNRVFWSTASLRRKITIFSNCKLVVWGHVWIPGISWWKGLGFRGAPYSNPKPPGPKPLGPKPPICHYPPEVWRFARDKWPKPKRKGSIAFRGENVKLRGRIQPKKKSKPFVTFGYIPLICFIGIPLTTPPI